MEISAWSIKDKINKLDFVKIESLYSLKFSTMRMKKKSYRLGKSIYNHILTKDSRVREEFSHSNNKNIPLEMAKRHRDSSSKKIYVENKHMKRCLT